MGKYVSSHLIKDESVVFETRLHWVIFFTWSSLFTLTIAAWIKRALSEFAVTNRRVVMKKGFIARDTFEMNISKIESVTVDQPFMGRIFNYGSLTVIGTGGTRETFHNIAKPMAFRRAFQEQC